MGMSSASSLTSIRRPRLPPASSYCTRAASQFRMTVIGAGFVSSELTLTRKRVPSRVAAELVAAIDERAGDARVEQRARRADLDPAGPRRQRHSHQAAIGRKVVELLAVAPPARLSPAARRHPGLGATSREPLHEDFPGSGFVGRVSDPAAVGRKLSLDLVGGRLHQRLWPAGPGEGNRQDVEVAMTVRVVQRQPSIERPVGHHEVAFARTVHQRVGSAAVGRDPEEVDTAEPVRSEKDALTVRRPHRQAGPAQSSEAGTPCLSPRRGSRWCGARSPDRSSRWRYACRRETAKGGASPPRGERLRPACPSNPARSVDCSRSRCGTRRRRQRPRRRCRRAAVNRTRCGRRL